MQKKAASGHLREYLKRLVKQGRLELFLRSFKLAPREKAAAEEVLVYASEQDKFPRLPGLAGYLIRKGFSSYYSSTLKTRGVITNLKKSSKIWSLSALALNSLQELYRLEPKEQSEASPVPVAEAQTPKPPTDQTKRLIGKVKEIWEAINCERVGNDLLLTSEFVHRLAEKIKCRSEYVWDIIRTLEKRGLYARRRLPGQGILINFSPSLEPEAPKAPSGTRREQGVGEITVSELVKRLREEIAGIEGQINALEKLKTEKQSFLASIEAYLK